MKPLVIFGSDEMGEIAHYYFSNGPDFEVVAFTLDSEYIKSDTFLDLPVIAFEKLKEKYPPEENYLFIALGYGRVNELRKSKYLEGKSMGYTMPSYVSDKATIMTEKIGENCLIMEDNTIQPFVTIEDNIIIWSGNHIGHHSTVKSHTFITGHVVISGGVTIEESCFLGANATLRDHITIGEKSVIGAGTLILSDVEPEGLYIGTATERAEIPSTQLRKI